MTIPEISNDPIANIPIPNKTFGESVDNTAMKTQRFRDYLLQINPIMNLAISSPNVINSPIELLSQPLPSYKLTYGVAIATVTKL